VVAVVVHWGAAEETLGCVASLAADGQREVIVVDNAAAEPVKALLAARASRARCLRTAENLGYAGGANVGIRAALADGAEVVLLLNNDARLHAGATAAATAALAADPRIAAVGAKVVTREDAARLWLAWGRVTYRESLVALCGADVPDAPMWNVARDVDWIAGCAMWMRATALEEIGLLDEAFFAYHEEVDWCASAREAGWRIRYAPTAVVAHTGRGSDGGRAAIRIRKYFAARNTVLFARKHAGALACLKLGAFLTATLPGQLLWNTLRGTGGEVMLKLAGFRDGLTGRQPPFGELGLHATATDHAQPDARG
jgi:GT2 family glycosyltransferase